MARYLTLIAGWLVLLGFSTLAPAAEEAADAVSKEAQQKLVQQLGDSSYAAREEAAKRLISQGLAAKPVLTEALDHADLEIRIRVHHILARIQQSELDARLAAFITDVHGEDDHGLPGWEPYRELVGGGREARRLFVEMIRTEASLLTAYEKGADELPQLFTVRVASLQPHVIGGSNQTNEIPSETMATLLLIGADKISGQNSVSMSQLYSLLNHPTAHLAITSGKHSPVLIELLEAWVTCGNLTVSHYGMMLALKYDLREAGLQQANKIISQQTTSSSMLQYAIVAVGKYGDEKHIPLLESLLDNEKVCHTWSNAALKKNGSIKIQVRDVALAIILHMTGRDPAKYGFKLLRENPETLYYIYTFGFIEEEEREAAHAKWSEESKASEK